MGLFWYASYTGKIALLWPRLYVVGVVDCQLHVLLRICEHRAGHVGWPIRDTLIVGGHRRRLLVVDRFDLDAPHHLRYGVDPDGHRIALLQYVESLDLRRALQRTLAPS